MAFDVIDELKSKVVFEHTGREKEFENNVCENMEQIIAALELPAIKLIDRQRQLRFEGGQVILDIAVRHVDDSATIFEVKKYNNKNPHTSTSNQLNAVGQMFLYRTVFTERTGVTPRIVLIDNKIHERTYKAFKDNRLPFTLMELQKDRLFVPYRYSDLY